MSDNLELPLNPVPEQVEMPFAMVQGEAWSSMPKDLYIPPDALEVFLDAFEGPLDLLLYLIRRQTIDILDIPILSITKQYMKYVELMKDFQLELAAEYLVMAAMLAEIKSRMLLPLRVEQDDEEGDPRAELIRRLQEYERYKQAAIEIDDLPRVGRELHLSDVQLPILKTEKIPVQVDLQALLLAMNGVMQRANLYTHHQIGVETLSVRERMSEILSNLDAESFTNFTDLFHKNEGRLGIVVTFLAVLELMKSELILIVQADVFAGIHLKARIS